MRTIRRLHASSVKGCATIIVPHAQSLSPVHGALCWGSPALAALWEIGKDARSPPVARLARALFHRHDPLEPLRLTANKSLPGCHLRGRPAWQGHLLGLACRSASSEATRDAFAKLGVPALARETKVSIARFEALVRLLGEALQPPLAALGSDGGSDAGGDSGSNNGNGGAHVLHEAALPPGLCGSAVWLAFLWGSAASKARRALDALSLHALSPVHPSSPPLRLRLLTLPSCPPHLPTHPLPGERARVPAGARPARAAPRAPRPAHWLGR